MTICGEEFWIIENKRKFIYYLHTLFKVRIFYILNNCMFHKKIQSLYIYIYIGCPGGECARLQENVPYVKVHRSNPKHLYPKFNGYGDNGERKVWSSCGSTYRAYFACCYPYTAHIRPSVSQPSQAHSAFIINMSQLQWIVIQYGWIFMCPVKCLEP